MSKVMLTAAVRVMAVTVMAVLVGAEWGGQQRPGPVVGILAQEPDPAMPAVPWTSYIAADYVKAVEAAGARVVPVHIRRPLDYYQELFSRVNGVLLPGGSAPLDAPDGYSEVASLVFKHAIKMKLRGERWPVLGVCLGLETLVYISNNHSSPLTVCGIDSENLPLRFNKAYHNTGILSSAYPEDLSILATLPVTSNHHGWCLTEEKMSTTGLSRVWRVVATSRSKASPGLEFVSVLEMADHPIAAVQFHPEKTAYEWNPQQNNPHSAKAIKANRVFYDWLVGEARHNNNRFPSDEAEFNLSIANSCPVYTAPKGAYSDQLYQFYN